MINTQYINLNMTPSGVMPVLYCSQYDIGRPLGMVVYNGGEAVDLDTYTCTIEATRTNGTAITAAVTTDGNIGAFVTTATMTNQADKYMAKLVLFDSNSCRVASLAFVVVVTEKTMDENAESIEEDASLYQQYTVTVQALIADIRSRLTDLENQAEHFEADKIQRYNLVADMVADTTLAAGMYVHTGGFSYVADGKDALYRIRAIEAGDTTDDRMLVLLDNGLVAEAIIAEDTAAPVVTDGTINAVCGVAETYLEYAYNFAGSAGIVYRHAGEFDGPFSPNPAPYDPTLNPVQYAIQCSTFAQLLMRGIKFEDSRYVDDENLSQIYGYDFDGTQIKGIGDLVYSWNIARYASQHGLLYRINSDFSNIRPGDFIFISGENGDESSVSGYRYHDISHVAFVVACDRYGNGVVIDARSYYGTTDGRTDKSKIGNAIYSYIDDNGVTQECGVRVTRSNLKNNGYLYGARFPLGDMDNTAYEVAYSDTPVSGSTPSGSSQAVYDTGAGVNGDFEKGIYTVNVKGKLSGGDISGRVYARIIYDDGDSSFQAGNAMENGDVFTLVFYARKHFKQFQVRIVSGVTYALESYVLWRGYNTSATIDKNTAFLLENNITALGAVIPSGSDLNNYTIPGKYRCQNSDIASSLQNTPVTTTGFSLIVMPTLSVLRPAQILIASTTGPEAIYWRISGSGGSGFGSWYKLTGTAVT